MLRVSSATAARVSTLVWLAFSSSRSRLPSAGSGYLTPWCRYANGLVVVNVLPSAESAAICISSECDGR